MRKRIVYLVMGIDEPEPMPWICVAEKPGYLELRPIHLDEETNTLFFEDTDATSCIPYSSIKFFIRNVDTKEYELRKPLSA